LAATSYQLIYYINIIHIANHPHMQHSDGKKWQITVIRRNKDPVVTAPSSSEIYFVRNNREIKL